MISQILITNEVGSNKSSDKLIKKFIELKFRKLFKLEKSKS